MSKMLKKLKLNELLKENLSSKEMQRIAGGCACAYFCVPESSEDFIGDYITSSNSGGGGYGCAEMNSMGY